jgi:6-phospho-beta-glucosidase
LVAVDRLGILAKPGCRAHGSTTHPGRAAPHGAAAVLLQIRVGGQAARHQDETWPLECGCVGQETTGAGGLAKALRTVPVVRDIAAQVREVAPRAWIVNFTNPVGIVTRALLDDEHRTVGLCNVAIGLQRLVAGLLDVAPGEIELDHVGLNHLTWELDVRRSSGGATTSVLADLLTRFGDELAADLELPASLLERLGVLPSYYLRYFYQHDDVVAGLRDVPTRAQAVTEIEHDLLELYADPAVDTKPELLSQRGGAYYSEAAVGLVGALLGTSATHRHVVNLRNAGTLPFLPDDAVVETSAHVDADGIRPLPAPQVPPLYSGLIAHVSAYEQLALDAARAGGRDRVFAALLAHPLVGQVDLADGLTDRLLAANAPFLPSARA